MKIQGLKRNVLLFVGLLILSVVPAMAQQTEVEDLDLKYATTLLKPGSVAPDFALSTPDGRTVRLSDYKGKYVVIDFWASWCSDCRKDAPFIVELYRAYKDAGIEFIGVSFDTDKESWMSAIKQYGMDYVQVSELKKMRETEVYKTYGIKWIPSLCLIDPQGKVMLSTVVSEKIQKALQDVVGRSSAPALGDKQEDNRINH